MLLFYTIPRRDTKQIGHDLIKKFGSISGVLDADEEEFAKIKGITERSVFLFKLIPHVISYYYTETDKGISYNNEKMLLQLFKPYLADKPFGTVIFACFDSDLAIVSAKEVGTTDSVLSPEYMRIIVSEALNNKCVAAALSHNHSGKTFILSDNTFYITDYIEKNLKMIGVKLIDHIIISEKMNYSVKGKEFFDIHI